ncbi:ATP-grasp domain-containing protein [Faecalicatena contorta]|uniref:Biotin carboxylase n=1 Tax=Faecalicatena contorta TaxID=39482 RepID=A0A315ZRP5_9FIRM|nr:ATP-grasp domain-containing protein [Faecalicatena contorta]PWJ48216.1 biotin carboxylase [Faecalicatena contorta]SUQ15492.1 Biotin carboxylase [Faecalicatena contorta]
MKPKVAIIGANDFQNQLITKAKEKGYETHVFAWECGDVGEKNADYFYPVSIVEKEEILEICKKIQPIGIISIASDLASITVNYVAEKLGLIGNGIESTILSTNKHNMRVIFEKNEIPSPKSILVENEQGSKDLKCTFPVIVKPTDRSGSRGIYKVEALKDLEFAIRRALHESFEKRVLVEEFAEGEEYSVEYISYNGSHYFLALTQKYTTGSPKFIETGHLEPAEIDEKIKEDIFKIVEKSLDALKIKNGASHSEVKIDKRGNIKVIEIGGRMGGDCIGSDLVELSTGYDFVGLVLDIACGKQLILDKKKVPQYSFVKFIFNKMDVDNMIMIQERYPEIVHRISRIEDMDNDKNIDDSSQRLGYYIFSTPDKGKMQEVINLLYGIGEK